MFDVVSQVRNQRVNFLERLWAYMTIKDLLEKVAKGEIDSCVTAVEATTAAAASQRSKRNNPEDLLYDDEDYYDYEEGSGGAGKSDGVEYGVEDIMDIVGDADIVMCNNLERALYLSLKYEFVTPLTSLVVVKPDAGTETGDLTELEAGRRIRLLSGAPMASATAAERWMRLCLTAVAVAATAGMKLL